MIRGTTLLFSQYFTFSTFNKHACSIIVGLEYGTRQRFAAIRVNLSVGFLGLSYTDGLPLYAAWENFTQTKVRYVLCAVIAFVSIYGI